MEQLYTIRLEHLFKGLIYKSLQKQNLMVEFKDAADYRNFFCGQKKISSGIPNRDNEERLHMHAVRCRNSHFYIKSILWLSTGRANFLVLPPLGGLILFVFPVCLIGFVFKCLTPQTHASNAERLPNKC